MDFFQYQAYIMAQVPWSRCGKGGLLQVTVPWARPGSRLFLLMEGLIIKQVKEMPVRSIAPPLRASPSRIWRAFNHYVEMPWSGPTAQA